MGGGINAASMLLPSWVPTPRRTRYRDATNEYENTVDELIAERRAHPEGYDDLLARMLGTESDGYAMSETEIAGYTIPEETTVMLPQFAVHTDERWYDDPDAFRPERWAAETSEDRPEYTYFPFGGGGHHCIGMRFATMELKHIVPIIARRVDFELSSTPDPAVQMEMTLQPVEDVRARTYKR